MILIVAAIYLYTKTPVTVQTGPVINDVSAQSVEVSSVIGSEYSALIQEELNKLSTEQTGFNNQAQDTIASDMSKFYYG